ncbi:TIR domain-containing protein [Ideonella sp. 4Y11]|uniref:TIR domain-containing protein n=1 Tax=Ideonella aquatica TaxID=2824119 RepID=A0A940YQN2_9BURK|nr:TIR domain-containing protein [Ideonella aquatica]MBQ0960218.1 TIR domain-containing protein [Ideonella aquatica]
MNTSLVSIVEVADNWGRYEAHLTNLAVDMLGSTPMREALEMVRDRFDAELRSDAFHETSVLFLLSDGMPNRGTEAAVDALAASIKGRHHIVVSCYVTDEDITEPRRLYDRPDPHWPDGAKLMFDCASQVAAESAFTDYLLEFGWTIDRPARLFAQINRSDVLTEFMNAVITPVSTPTSPAADESFQVFISYAHEDEDFRVQLEKHLSALRRQGLVDIWNDRKITAGAEWKGAIDANLNSADLILLLISEDFLHSDYCYDIELKRALERHEANEAIVVPIILKPVDWHGTPFSKLAALPTDARPITKWRSRASAFAEVAAGIRNTLQSLKKRR